MWLELSEAEENLLERLTRKGTKMRSWGCGEGKRKKERAGVAETKVHGRWCHFQYLSAVRSVSRPLFSYLSFPAADICDRSRRAYAMSHRRRRQHII